MGLICLRKMLGTLLMFTKYFINLRWILLLFFFLKKFSYFSQFIFGKYLLKARRALKEY